MKQKISSGTIVAVVVVAIAIIGFVAYRSFGPASGTQGGINKALDAKHMGDNPMMQRNDPEAIKRYREQMQQNAAKGQGTGGGPGQPTGPPTGMMGGGSPR